MNFHDLEKIEKYDFYLDLAFSRAKKSFAETRQKAIKVKDGLKRIKQAEYARLDTIKDALVPRLDKILMVYPELDSLAPFYNELVKATLDYAKLKKSLGAIKWCNEKIREFHRQYLSKIAKARDVNAVKLLSKQYYGRISSLFKQIKGAFAYLELSRKVMKEYPSLKSGVFTVCISGFPNVGKSTLLAKLTGASPEIGNYAFTTKSLNLGYIKGDYNKVQVIDTPGSLNRYEKLNSIEKQAYLAVKHLADVVVYVFDPTEEYPMHDQKQLLKKLREFEKPVILYLSKTDISEKEAVELIIKGYKEKLFTSSDEVKNALLKLSLEPKKNN
ncbi:MAG: GTPase [archaeon]